MHLGCLNNARWASNWVLGLSPSQKRCTHNRGQPKLRRLQLRRGAQAADIARHLRIAEVELLQLREGAQAADNARAAQLARLADGVAARGGVALRVIQPTTAATPRCRRGSATRPPGP